MPELALPTSLIPHWKIQGTLTTLSPLRVGDGAVSATRLTGAAAENSEAEVATVFTVGPDGPAYLPGSSLRGYLRGLCESGGTTPWADELFGYQDRHDPATDSALALGGRLTVEDAVIVSSPADNPGPHWNPRRATCVASHVVIDRQTRTPAHNLLFFEEYVPAGTTFAVTLLLEGPPRDPNAVRHLLDVLAGFAASGHRLGASFADGWGQVAWKLDEVSQLTPESIKNWLASKDGLLTDFLTPVKLAAAGSAPKRSVVEIEVALQFTGPFLTNDPSRVKPRSLRRDRGDDTQDPRPNHAAARTPDGRPLLLASSFRGALRSQAERIRRTLGDEIAPPSALLALLPEEKPAKLDLVRALFGVTGWRAVVETSDFLGSEPGTLLRHEFLAIDRFTGGGAPGLKFNADAFWRPLLRGRISIDTARLNETGHVDPAWRLLAQSLRDLAEGDICLGFGAAKGFGACEAQIKVASGLELIPESTRAVFEKGFRPAAPPALAESQNAPQSMRTIAPKANEFFHVSHFHPIGAPSKGGLTADDLAKRQNLGAVTHDRYVAGTFSGRLHCRLHNETPLMIGSTQDDAVPKNVSFFQVPGTHGQLEPAIPSTSLRGLISSTVEALSNSALRVLDNPDVYSRRASMDEYLSAVGMVVRRQGKWFIRPLCLPMFQKGELKPVWKKYFPQEPVLRTYFGNKDQIRDREKFLPGFPSWLPEHRDATNFKVARNQWASANAPDLASHPRLKAKGSAVLAMERDAAEQARPGVIRVLGCDEKRRHIAGTKKHELFIPVDDIATYPVDAETAPESNLLSLPDPVRTAFEELADEMTAQWRGVKEDVRPYEPWGTRPGRSKEGRAADRRLRLQPGDLVFFDIETPMGAAVVKEISFSSIWRKKIKGRCHDYFARISRDLLPMGPSRLKDAKGVDRPLAEVPITPAERLFGFVEIRETKSDKPLLSLASRVRFSTGRWNRKPGPVFGAPETLKILSTPKPPSPPLYFHRSGDTILKKDLRADANPAHLPLGRKAYLHHASALQGQRPWATSQANAEKNLEQKVSIRPVEKGHSFDFYIDFDNLTQNELDLLVAALAPVPGYRHKLGLGKPLGLGTVRLDLLQLSLVDRAARYQEAAGQRWTLAAPSALPELPAGVLQALGASAYAAVSYPVVENASDAESEHFAWFVSNNELEKKAVGLRPIGPDGIRPLPKLAPPKKKD